MKYLHLVVEGETERVFVENTLKPFFKSFDILVKPPVIGITSRQRRTGITDFEKPKKDIENVLTQNRRNPDIVVSTMFDLAQLPSKFPGYQQALQFANPYDQVNYLEKQMEASINNDRFVAYLQLFEFEALILSHVEAFVNEFPNRKQEIKALENKVSKLGNPELVNHNRYPSLLIGESIPEYRHRKVFGAEIAQKIGVENLIKNCSHFGKWIERIKEKCG